MRNDHTGDCPLNSDPAFYTQDMVCTCAVVQVSREKSREISQRGRDAIVNAATPSPDESGLEVPKVVARLMTWRGGNGYPGNHEWSPCARTYNELPKDHYPDGPWAEGEPLMTVAQCKRIVAAKDAEIARRRELHENAHSAAKTLMAERATLMEQAAHWLEVNAPSGGCIETNIADELRAEAEQLRAQPARPGRAPEHSAYEAQRCALAKLLGAFRDAPKDADQAAAFTCADELFNATTGVLAKDAVQPAHRVGGDFNWLLGLIDEECRYWHGRGDEARRSVCANLLAAAGESPQVNFEVASAASQACDDYRALECAKKVMALVYGPTPIGGSCQLLSQVQRLIIEALAPAASPDVAKLQAELDRKNDLLNRAVEVMGQMRAAMDSSKGALDKLQAYFVANPPTPEQKRRWARELGKPPKE